MVVNIDFESRSMIDLRKVGLYVYAAHPTTEILCAAYAVAEGPVSLWTMGEAIPFDFIELVMRGDVEWHAWNAQFERVMWRDVWARPGGPMHAYGAPALEEWHCSMARGALYGLPLALAQAASALRLSEAKDMGGRALMLQMTRPRKIVNGKPEWWDQPEKMAELGKYCKNDVAVERAIARRLKPLSVKERAVYLLDQKINDRGIGLDRKLAAASRSCAKEALVEADAAISELTLGKVTRTNQVAALTKWVQSQGVAVDTLAAGTIEQLLASPLPEIVSETLEVRIEAAKSSVAKLDSMLLYASGVDNRMRGLLQYSGAATGRWAGRGPQPHNLPRGTVPGVEAAIPLILAQDLDALDLFAPAMEVLSSALRAHMVPAEGNVLLAGDYSAIEARVLAWLAGQHDLLKMFREGRDPYVAMASSIYHRELGGVSKAQRAFGKVAVLGLGYQMGRKTFRINCALRGISITEEFAEEAVNVYRLKNDRIKQLWYDLDDAAHKAVRVPGSTVPVGKLAFVLRRGWLEMILPSGRSLYYAQPSLQMVKTPWDEMREVVVCHGYSTLTRIWGPRKMYGGLWAENATQAVARDILAESMLLLEEYGFPLVLTVHDEAVAEVRDSGSKRLATFTEIMRQAPDWARGCPIAVESFVGTRYRKG